MNSTQALVLFSGGQDSTTCLAWALNRYQHVETVAFDYRQRHRVELDCSGVVRDRIAQQFPGWGRRLGPHHLLDIGVLGQISDTALTSDAEIALRADGLPNTFVPGRNLLFLTLAAALGYRRNLPVLVGGMCETDFSGYPDCRDSTMEAMQQALTLGIDPAFVIETPLMWLDKAGIWGLAHTLGGEPLVRIVREDTHTCYNGDREHMHDWGLGCGACPACELRSRGHAAWQQAVASRQRPSTGR